MCHVYEHFDSRGTQGRQPGCILYFSLAAEEMGREAGTAGPFVMPEPRSYTYTEVLLHESNAVPSPSSDLPATSETAIHPELVVMLGHSILVERASGADGIDLFEETVKADLQKIYATPAGRALLQSLHASGKQTSIIYAMDGLNRAIIPKANVEQCYYQTEGNTPGSGVGLTVAYNPSRQVISKAVWGTRPPAIGLAHELIHAEQAAYGKMRKGLATNPGQVSPPDPTEPVKIPEPVEVPIMELETVGVPPYDEYYVNENKIRQQWTPAQPLRPRY